ncbi:sigma factor-like helix-turn-helix DNA-binding protein [Nonomuraea sp. SYSU D8015]
MLSRTLAEAGEQHGLRRGRIRQIEKQALVELKKPTRDPGSEPAA